MPRLLTQSDLRPLFETPAYLEQGFAAIERSILDHQAGLGGEGAAIQFPTGDGSPDSIWRIGASAAGSTLQVYAPPGQRDFIADQQIMLLFGGRPGRLLALYAGDDLNVLRTAVPAGVGARHLSPENPRVLAIIGSGLQARFHLRTILHALPGIEVVRVYSPTRAHREAYAERMSTLVGRRIEPVDTAEAAVEDANVISSTATAGAPPIDSAAILPGALVITIAGSVLQASLPHRVVVPAMQGPQMSVIGLPIRSGRDPSTVHATLADVIQGKTPARVRADEVVLYDLAASRAWDLAICEWAFNWATEHDVGTAFSLSASTTIAP